jgi:mono/diheme cytochrome c family protein
MVTGRTLVAVIGAVALLVLGVGAGLVAAQGEWKAPADAKGAKNPEKGVATKSADTNCASCHGKAGKGDGPAAAALNPKPADWTSAKVQAQTDGEIFWKITNGRGAMPPWKHLPDKERWELVNYIRGFKKK